MPYRPDMWARVHKLDSVRAVAGNVIVVLEDGRSVSQMQRIPSLSTLIAVARVLAARRALDAKFAGKGEVRYAATALPSFLSEAVTRAGAAIAERDGQRITIPAHPASVAALVDIAFSELAHHVRTTLGAADVNAAIRLLEKGRAEAPLDKDAKPELYWPAVFELAALGGEQGRKAGGRWIDTRDMPVGYAMKFPSGAVSHPTVVAQRIVEGANPDDPLAPPAA